MYKDFVIDATMYHEDGLFCFIPVEDWDTDAPTFVVGMNLLTSLDGFCQGNLVGVMHEAGQEAAEQWCAAHPEVGAEIERRRRPRHESR